MNTENLLSVFAKKAPHKRNAVPKKHGGRKDVPKQGGSVRNALLRRIHKNPEIQRLLLKNPKYDIIVVRKTAVKADDGVANLTNVGGNSSAVDASGNTAGWPVFWSDVLAKVPEKRVNKRLLKDHYTMASKSGADDRTAREFALQMHKHFRKKQEGKEYPLTAKLQGQMKQFGSTF